MISSTRYRTQAEIHRQTSLAKEIANLQQSVSSGKRITRASDDPGAADRISEIRQVQADQVVWTNNANTGASIAETVDTSLGSIADMLDRAKELVLRGRNDTTSQTDRTALANELRSLSNDLDAASTANDPTGAPLYPTGTPLSIPVSQTLSVPATATRSSVFGGVATSGGAKTLQQILNDAAATVESTAATRSVDIQNALNAIDAGAAHVTQVRGDQGVRAARFDQAKTDLVDSGETLSEERSGLESTDLTYAVSEFQSKQTALQAAQTMFAKTHQSTLFDLLG